MKVSIIIKALNEEKDIGKAIQSSLDAIEEIGGDGEVILADSLSTDDTIEIARKYPIKIVQLVNQSDRSCGIGAELGMVGATGEYIYILDADMEFISGFLAKAISKLDEDESLAGVAGVLQEMHLDNIEFQERNKRKNPSIQPGKMKSLPGGGLYRAEALRSVQYFTHQGLNSQEEFELGARLKMKGWGLLRMDIPSVRHYAYQMNAYKLLFRRVKSGYIYGLGELLRSAYGKPHFFYIFNNIKQIKLLLAYNIWFVFCVVLTLFVAVGSTSLVALLMLFSLPLVVMTIKKKSFKVGLYSFVSGLFNSYGLVVGFFKGRIKKPTSKIDYKNVK